MTATQPATDAEVKREASLELVGLRRRFGPVVALDGLTFRVPPGQVFGFLGPNGAGKTTTMRAIFGVVRLDEGQVRWNGEPVSEESRRSFGYMPEERGLYPGMPILEQLEYLGRLHDMPAKAAREAARYWLGRLGLAGRESDKLEALSHGNQQRVQLAAALVFDPELLVLDEPFAGLDPGGVDDMSQILTERATAGATVLFSSHQLDLVEHLCTSVAIIYRGRVVAQGGVAELERGKRPRLAVRVAGDPAGDWARTVDLAVAEKEDVKSGMVLFALAPGADSQRVLDAARAAGSVEHFSFELLRLSQVFRDVGGGSHEPPVAAYHRPGRDAGDSAARQDPYLRGDDGDPGPGGRGKRGHPHAARAQHQDAERGRRWWLAYGARTGDRAGRGAGWRAGRDHFRAQRRRRGGRVAIRIS